MHDIHFKDSPSWTLHLANTTNVHVFNLMVTAANHSHNTDGIDIECSVNVLVENYFYNGGKILGAKLGFLTLKVVFLEHKEKYFTSRNKLFAQKGFLKQIFWSYTTWET